MDAVDHALLYDGECGFCRLAAKTVMRLDEDDRLRAVAIQSEEGQRLLTEVPPERRLDTMHLVTPGGHVLSGADAAAPLSRLLKGGHVPSRAMRRFPEQTARAYAFVSRHRGKLGTVGLRASRSTSGDAAIIERCRGRGDPLSRSPPHWSPPLVVAAGCGSSSSGDPALTVYVSAPLSGPDAGDGGDVADAARRALEDAGGQAGGTEVKLVVLDDAGPGGATDALAGANARQATEDSTAIAYVGELDSGTTRTSLPITNQAGMLQVSPGASAVDLTRSAPGSDQIPQETQPSGSRTFGRVIPSDTVQGAAAAVAAGDAGVRSVVAIDSKIDVRNGSAGRVRIRGECALGRAAGLPGWG